MKTTRWAVLAGALALAGCGGGAISVIPAPSAESQADMRRAFHVFDHTHKERQVGASQAEQIEAVQRVWARVWPAAVRVCQRSFQYPTPEGCQNAHNHIRVVVHAADPTINAYAAANWEIGLYGGFVLATGNDDEVAAVLAHEIAHLMFDHNRKTGDNTGWGMLAGAVAGLAAGVVAYPEGGDIGGLGQAGMTLGGSVGQVAYSRDMEMEADHYAAFVTYEAGYDPVKGAQVLIRMTRTDQAARAAGGRSFLSRHFRTHPTDEERLAVWIETVRAIERGQQRPMYDPEKVR